MKSSRPVKLRFTYTKDGLDANFVRNGNYYGVCSIRKCRAPIRDWYIEMLIPGNVRSYYDLQNPVRTLREAKSNARKIAELVVKDFQEVTFI